MARRRAAAVPVQHDDDIIAEIAAWYREWLTQPAALEAQEWTPVYIGPTWQTDAAGRFVLPRYSLGWYLLGWAGRWLQLRPGEPWRFTKEQARFLLWWYAVDEHGRFIYRDGVLQRLKGWGKDPLGATICAMELLAPVRFSHWGADGQPVGRDVPDAWVQTAAVSMEQTKNTMRLFPVLFSDEAIARFRLAIGAEQIKAFDGKRVIQAVTSSPRTLEGARASFVLANETQHWLSNNDGWEMWAVIERNATKSADGAARTLAITNAYEPSDESVAQRAREAWEAAQAGTHADTGLLYDSVEAPPEAPLTAEAAPAVVQSIRGDASWLDPDRIVSSILDPRNPPSRSRRFWYNQIVAAEDAWVDPRHFDAMAAPDKQVAPRDEIAMFFDGSKSDDASALVGCRISDGHVITLGVWQRPPGERGKNWLAPRGEISAAVDVAMERYNVVAFWADPSHAFEDETGQRYWDGLLDDWHRKYKDSLTLWALPGKHSIMWDMAAPSRVAQFTAAAERTAAEIEAGEFTHDAHPLLRQHAHNARRYPNRWGVSLWKGHRESPRKVDAAVAMVGARMVRREFLNTRKRPRTGRVW